jgi:CRISPR-associated endonuclease Cas2
MDNNYTNHKELSFAELLINALLSSGGTKSFHDFLNKDIDGAFKTSGRNFKQNIYRLKEKGLIDINEKEIKLTTNKSRLNAFLKYRYIYKNPEKDNKLILIFDIPEKQRKTRDWLRNQIKLWGFTMIQKSVWLGTGPLPNDFNDRIKLLGIEKNIRIFNIQSKK